MILARVVVCFIVTCYLDRHRACIGLLSTNEARAPEVRIPWLTRSGALTDICSQKSGPLEHCLKTSGTIEMLQDCDIPD
jgi:hypothetical protein